MVELPKDPDELVKHLQYLSRRLGARGVTHLDRAVIATRIAEAADYLARFEVVAARTDDENTWQEVGNAFGIGRQTAHERFSEGPDGMRSRSTRYGAGWRATKAAQGRPSAKP